ncbi:hypothetical protein [Accumulibacter sp.]|uniref:hypothetical protein n=1 Tax=Accumulibacter sp. TaxID=2053492 RepID=UPI00260E46F5|nr:hypothetical protein [Accumulibacter sp.]
MVVELPGEGHHLRQSVRVVARAIDAWTEAKIAQIKTERCLPEHGFPHDLGRALMRFFLEEQA